MGFFSDRLYSLARTEVKIKVQIPTAAPEATSEHGSKEYIKLHQRSRRQETRNRAPFSSFLLSRRGASFTRRTSLGVGREELGSFGLVERVDERLAPVAEIVVLGMGHRVLLAVRREHQIRLVSLITVPETNKRNNCIKHFDSNSSSNALSQSTGYSLMQRH